MKSSATMSIGEAAGHFGLAAHVLRHWEDMGLLSPVRAAGGRRRYDHSDLHRVAAILLAKDAGLALTDIRDILTTADVGKRRDITRRHCDELTRRIEEMQADPKIKSRQGMSYRPAARSAVGFPARSAG